MKQKIIVGNWKENPESLEIAKRLLEISKTNIPQSCNASLAPSEGAEVLQEQNIKILHAVPSIFVGSLVDLKYDSLILQDVSEYESGSHTGEISVKQMLDSGIKASIVGHSETRLSPNNLKGDENKQVNLKIKNLVSNKCGFILCVGEYERDDADYLSFVKSQLEECLQDVSEKEIADNIIAYEPVWAIGKNAKRVATNVEVMEMVKFIKEFVKEKWGVEAHVLYGGSVDENNAKEILGLEGVDGLLVGRASSDPFKWEELLKNIATKSNENASTGQNSVKKDLKYKTISDLEVKTGDRVLLRLDLNVPMNDKGEIVNDFRIQESLPTIKLLQGLGAKVTILAHKEKGDFKEIAKYLGTLLENFYFLGCDLQNGEVLLLDNMRLNEGEKKNDVEFATHLASLGDFYINEAFSASHREHASIVGIPKIMQNTPNPSLSKEGNSARCALGPKFINEIEKLGLALHPKHPLLLIVGGAKFDTKLSMLEKFLNIAEHIFVGGALAHNFWKQKFEYNLGKSLIDEEVKLSEVILNEVSSLISKKIILPKDVMVESREVKKPDEILESERIVDFGPESLKQILSLAEQAKTIVWNGPLGYYEGGYDTGTKNLLLGLSDLQKKYPSKTIILGGGDTVTEIDKTNEELVNSGQAKMQFTHVSTGGGAMIDFLSNGTLPGIDAVKLEN
jgi:phosphoglycerate kinase